MGSAIAQCQCHEVYLRLSQIGFPKLTAHPEMLAENPLYNGDFGYFPPLFYFQRRRTRFLLNKVTKHLLDYFLKCFSADALPCLSCITSSVLLEEFPLYLFPCLYRADTTTCLLTKFFNHPTCVHFHGSLPEYIVPTSYLLLPHLTQHPCARLNECLALHIGRQGVIFGEQAPLVGKSQACFGALRG